MFYRAVRGSSDSCMPQISRLSGYSTIHSIFRLQIPDSYRCLRDILNIY
ncbi:hypothetical protein GF345_03120 [Candidatus Woesearchaeota archaeon]|nr:hypothetical protein [Candidatus Woesearchaeota archaeon]